MPSVQIEIRMVYSQDEEIAIIEAVHMAMQEAFRIKPDDRHIRLVVHEPHRFVCPTALRQPERFTLVSIDAFSGRSREAKRALYAGIVQHLEPLGIPRDHVMIVLRESAQENWGIRGGQAACDVDLGFTVAV